MSEQLLQRGELLDSARGTDGTCRKPAADGAAAAQVKQARSSTGQGTAELPLEQGQSDDNGRDQAPSAAKSAPMESLPGTTAPNAHPLRAHLVPGDGAPCAGRMPNAASPLAQREDVQQEPSSSVMSVCTAPAAAPCPEGAATASTAADVQRPASTLAQTCQDAAPVPDTVHSSAGISPPFEHAVSGMSDQGSGGSGALPDRVAAAGPPGSVLAAGNPGKSSAGPPPLRLPETGCGADQPAAAANSPAAEATSRQPEPSTPSPVSLPQVKRTRSSGVVASAISALGLGRSASIEGGAQEAAKLGMPQGNMEPRRPQLCPQEFEAAWFCGPSRSASAVQEASPGMHSSCTPAAAAVGSARPAAEAGTFPMTPAGMAAKKPSLAAAPAQAAQGTRTEVGPSVVPGSGIFFAILCVIFVSGCTCMLVAIKVLKKLYLLAAERTSRGVQGYGGGKEFHSGSGSRARSGQ